jgi:UDP-N-acetyl-D-mannosaminuronic acid transferase (WecB/TagA/CpsF family)
MILLTVLLCVAGSSRLAKKGVTKNAEDWAIATTVAEYRQWVEAFVNTLEDGVQVKRVLNELCPEQQRFGKSLNIWNYQY